MNHNHHHDRNQRPQESPVVSEAKGKITSKSKLSEFCGEELVVASEKMGKHLAKEANLCTSQIRKFLDAVITVKGNPHIKTEEYRAHAMMIKPKLAYAAARARKGNVDPVKPLQTILEVCIDKVNDKNDFEQLALFVESIVAYHKYFGGRD